MVEKAFAQAWLAREVHRYTCNECEQPEGTSDEWHYCETGIGLDREFDFATSKLVDTKGISYGIRDGLVRILMEEGSTP